MASPINNAGGLCLLLLILSGCLSPKRQYVATKDLGDYKIIVQRKSYDPLKHEAIFSMRIADKADGDSSSRMTTTCNATRAEKLRYFNFLMSKDVFLISGTSDSIKAQYVLFDNAPAMSSNSDFIVAFNSDKLNADNQYLFLWNDNILCNGVLKFQINI